jgi:hypothetical protein
MSETSPADKPLDARVREVIESVRPYIQADGGDIELVAIEGDVVKVKLRGRRGAAHARARAGESDGGVGGLSRGAVASARRSVPPSVRRAARRIASATPGRR